ncbi:NmrA family NAD(P)-binding protein [Streptomyces sp. NPDC057307]|uniref:NmrA family NAD(P)-binding protein n=1 Tax=Streptomyces sp. NPDC057307 TaxID=3346096 RepID=UPI003644BCC9
MTGTGTGTTTGTVLVTGATGAVGGRLVRKLVADGNRVRALVRSPERVSALAGTGAEPVLGDLHDVPSLDAALKGVDRAFLLLEEDAGRSFSEAAARAAGLRQIVVLSATAAADPSYENPMFRKHVLGERHVRGTGVPWVFLRPGAFASLALHWAPALRGDGVVRVPHPELAVPLIDPRDIADVAAVVLGSPVPDWAGRVVPLSGPEVLTLPRRAEILSAELGRPLRVVGVPEEQWVALAARQLPEEFARALAGVERYFTAHPPKALSTVQEITGSPARDFHTWVRDHAGAFGLDSSVAPSG